MLVVAAGRQLGRTTALASWLLGGHPLVVWPEWSRMLVVPNGRRADQVATEQTIVADALRVAGAPSLRRLVLSLDELRMLANRGTDYLDTEVEFALDDADHIITHACRGIVPTMISIEGVSRTPGEIIANHPAPAPVSEPEPELPNWPHGGGTAPVDD